MKCFSTGTNFRPNGATDFENERFQVERQKQGAGSGADAKLKVRNAYILQNDLAEKKRPRGSKLKIEKT